MHRIPSIAIGNRTRSRRPACRRWTGSSATPSVSGCASATAGGSRDRYVATIAMPITTDIARRYGATAIASAAVERAKRAGGHPADAPEPVEALEDRPAVHPLHAEAVGVHRRVHRRVEHAEHEVREREHRPRLGESNRCKRDDEPDAREDGEARTPHARDEHAGQAAREQPADRQRGDGGAELGVRQPERVLDRGQPRQHRCGDRAMGEEQRADGDPGGSGARGIDGRRHGTTHGAGCPAPRVTPPRAARPGVAPPRDVSYRHSDA